MAKDIMKQNFRPFMAILKKNLRKFYAYYVKRDQKVISAYSYLDAGGEKLRMDYPLDKNSIVIDAGGYIGDFAEELVAKFDCSIDVFEPVESYAKKIKERFESNSKVRVINSGLGHTKKEEVININGLGSSVFDSKEILNNKEVIKIISAVDYLRIKNYPVIDLMKINIEGGEYELLNSLLDNPDVINKIRFLQIQFHDFVLDADKMRKDIQNELSKTHKLMWDFPFIWESWERIK
jgi:FkbM family methyltransferase